MKDKEIDKAMEDYVYFFYFQAFSRMFERDASLYCYLYGHPIIMN